MQARSVSQNAAEISQRKSKLETVTQEVNQAFSTALSNIASKLFFPLQLSECTCEQCPLHIHQDCVWRPRRARQYLTQIVNAYSLRLSTSTVQALMTSRSASMQRRHLTEISADWLSLQMHRASPAKCIEPNSWMCSGHRPQVCIFSSRLSHQSWTPPA